MVNLLLRTSNRPIGFNRMLNSIRSNDLTDVRIIVSVDNESTKRYVLDSGIPVSDIIEFKHDNRINMDHNPYDLYLNDMIDMVTDGWIMFVDDDDYIDINTISNINNICVDETIMYLFKSKYIGFELPKPDVNGYCAFCKISIANMVIHNNNKLFPKFKGIRGSDWHVFNDYYMSGGLTKYLDVITYYCDRPNGDGHQRDI